uniref:Constitutive coactivator of peroxisome proliferator-activated receptor gamma n=1 Tax=Anopheles coluzzii TaxID=1518534 RepID=A0A8W7Q155_ANOCL
LVVCTTANKIKVQLNKCSVAFKHFVVTRSTKMGIRHLHTFMEKNGGFYTVNMEREILEAKKFTENPLLVIDMKALHAIFSTDKRSLLCGSQFSVVEHMVDTFFKRLTDAGAELVFCDDGTLDPNKFEKWIASQNEKYDRMINVLDGIDAEPSLKEAADKFEQTIPYNTCIKLKNVAKRHGKFIVCKDLKCDQALASYATKFKALAVVTHDTDFLIFEGRWQLWHANHIDVNKLITKAYCKQELLRTLGLQWRQMAIWATLAGNSFFKYDELVPFLSEFGPNNQKFYRLAEYVRQLPLRNGKLDDDTVHSILGRVYWNRQVPPEAYEWFRQSVAFYQLNEPVKDSQQNDGDPFAYLLEDEHYVTYNILTDRPYTCTILFFDYRTSEIGNYYEIIEPIIARMAGILLYHNKEERQHVTLAIKRNHHESHSIFTVPATFPTAITPPPLIELISKDERVQASLLDRKLQLWRWVCSDDLLDVEQFNTVPPAFMCTVLTLYRLRQCGAIRIFEADLLLLIAQQLSKGVFDLTLEPHLQRLNPRAFRLAFVFQNVYHHMARVAKVLGLSEEYRPMTPYDGHRFHNMYNVWTSLKVESEFQSIEEWRFYKHAKSHAVQNE